MNTVAELRRRRLELLREECPVCDLGQAPAKCTCREGLDEVARIEAELRHRGETVRFP